MLIEFFVFLFGLCIGSFLNVVIYRYNTGWKITGRSKCLSCDKTLAWYELIPLFSFLFLKGKCRECKSSISWQYPIIEFVTGALFLAVYEKYALSMYTLYYIVLWSLLMVIFVYDLRHKIIPDGMVYVFMFMSLFLSVLTVSTPAQLVGILCAGPAIALPFLLMWLISKGAWMGFGDVKLALGIGWMLGLAGGFAAIILAFWIGAFIGILLMLFRFGNLGLRSEIPFAPFLIIGIAIVFFGNIGFNDLISLFSFTT